MTEQLPLPYIPHQVGTDVIGQRQKDGYINATAMCKAAGKQFGNYNRLATTKAFTDELISATGIPLTELIQSVTGGNPAFQCSWVHPQVAVNLGQWVSPKFAVLVSKWVHDWMRGTAHGQGTLPYHLRRYVANQQNVPSGHFSVLTEMTLAFIAPLEAAGYQLPERLWPDISQGKMFARYLREEMGVNTDKMPTYMRQFEDNRLPAQAKAYPNSYLPIFRTHFTEVWMPQRLTSYLAERDPGAIPFATKAHLIASS